jgi:hypothetical protein
MTLKFMLRGAKGGTVMRFQETVAGREPSTVSKPSREKEAQQTRFLTGKNRFGTGYGKVPEPAVPKKEIRSVLLGLLFSARKWT